MTEGGSTCAYTMHTHFLSMLLKPPLSISINLGEEDKTKLTAGVALQKAEFK